MLSVKAKEARELTFTVTRDGLPLDLTGVTLTFSMKRHKDDGASLVTKNDADFDKTGQTAGVVSIFLTAADLNQIPGPYVGELKMAFADAKGTIEKSDDVTIIIAGAVTD